MSITKQPIGVLVLAISLLLASAGKSRAQSSADQSFKSIPQQVKTNAENKATTKSNDVSNAAMTKLDSASNRAFRKFTGLFSKKNTADRRPTPDTIAARPVDSTISNRKNIPS
jgi:hypothetical protein